MRDWIYASSEGLSSGEMSSSGQYDVLRGVSDFTGSFHWSPDCLDTYASTFLTAKLTYWDEPKAQALTPFSSSTCLVDLPIYTLGGPMFSPLSSKYRHSHWWLVRRWYIGDSNHSNMCPSNVWLATSICLDWRDMMKNPNASCRSRDSSGNILP